MSQNKKIRKYSNSNMPKFIDKLSNVVEDFIENMNPYEMAEFQRSEEDIRKNLENFVFLENDN